MEKHISLIGFMGSGKSSIGKELSKLLPGYELVDLDHYIEAMTGRTIPEIFKEQGEDAFRALEKSALDDLLTTDEVRGTRTIFSLGGGTVIQEACRRLIQCNTECFYLKASVETLAANLKDGCGGRPMLQPGKDLRSRIEELMAERGPVYESTAHHTIGIDGKSLPEILHEILALLDVLDAKLKG